MENDELAILCIPELGGKIASLVNKENGFDCAFVNPYTEAPWKGIPLPDKGELWTQAFETAIDGGSIAQKVHGVRFPYLFSRAMSLQGNRLKMDYTLENLCAFDFKYQWSMQPHFRLSGNMEIVAPERSTFFVDWSKNYNFETAKKKYGWPIAGTKNDGTKIDFSRIDAMNGDADKLYLADLARGEVSLVYHEHSQKGPDESRSSPALQLHERFFRTHRQKRRYRARQGEIPE
jgi:hypothetical protein